MQEAITVVCLRTPALARPRDSSSLLRKFHQITEQLESLSWKVDQLYNEEDAQVEKVQAKLTATLEIHERITVLEALAAARPVRTEDVTILS